MVCRFESDSGHKDQVKTWMNEQGQKTIRIEALSDGVFAIAMTLLVLDLHVPISASTPDLPDAIFKLWPQFVAYIVSFMVLAVYWIGHHNQFHWIEHSSRTLLWINIFFLMSIAFLPFSTSLLANYNKETMPVLIYGINVIFSGLALYAHWVYASGKGKLISSNISARAIYITKFRIFIGIVFYGITTLIAFYSTTISLLLFTLLPFLYMLPSKVDKYFKNELEDRSSLS
jgi:uncharacterized membrane protein